MREKLLPFIISLFLCIGSVFSQTRLNDGLFKSAEREYKNLRYSYALPFYTAYLSRQPQDTIALLHLADSYRLLKQNDSAATYYHKYLSLKPADKIIWHRYAELAASTGNYEEAIKSYSYLKQIPAQKKDSLTRLALLRIKGFSETEFFLKDSLDYSVRYLNLNTPQQDFSPFLNGDSLIFISNRYRKINAGNEYGWDGLPFARFLLVKNPIDIIDANTAVPKKTIAYNRIVHSNQDYTARTSNDNDAIQVNSIPGTYQGAFKDLPVFAELLAGNFNLGPACINKEGSHIYYTRNSTTLFNNKYNLEIWEAVYMHGQWQYPKKLPFVKPGFDFYHPAISQDGKTLYFCSNMPGGFGGSDVYAVNTSRFGAKEVPVNLGEKINTAGDELFPVVNNEYLYFSSDGHPGLGGLDIYRTLYTDNGHYWSEPVNIGYPVNTPGDDFGLVFRNNKEDGFFTSNRLGNDDIFYFSKNDFRVQLTGTLLNKSNQLRLPETKVFIFNSEQEVIDSMVTDITGNYQFKLKPGRLYSLRFTKDGFATDSISVDLRTKNETAFEMLPTVLAPFIIADSKTLAVKADQDGDGITDAEDKCPGLKGVPALKGCPEIAERIAALAKHIFFATASADIRDSSFHTLNELAELLRAFPGVTLEINGYTDNQGAFIKNIQLSKHRAEAIKLFLVSKGLDARLLRTNGYGPANPVASNNQESGREKNRRVEMKAYLKM